MAALGVVEAGDTPENRAALAKIQTGASTPKSGGKGQTGTGTGQGTPDELVGEGTPVNFTPGPGAPKNRKTKQVWDEATGTFKTVEVP
jgi:hypothetical protein